MPASTDLIPDHFADDQPAADIDAQDAAGPAGQLAGVAPADTAAGGPLMIAIDQLTAHPGNVRQDLDLTRQFCASVAEAGVRIPLLVTPAEQGYRVIEGHRRLAAALNAGLAAVPCTLDPDRADDEAGQYLDMAVANSGSMRQNLAPQEEADALFAASEAGATRTRIRKATGRTAAEVKAALLAGQLSGPTRARTAELHRQPSLDELALLAEFDGDDQATGQLLNAIGYDYGLEHIAERIRQDRAEAAQHDQLVAELQAAGVTVTDTLPDGARQLTTLTHDGEDLTPEGHAECPGRGAFFKHWAPLEPYWYCTSPDTYGHIYRYLPAPAAPGESSTPEPLPDPPSGTGDPDRRLVIEGNKAWAAAAEVRKRWLRTLLARRTAPRPVAPFVATQLLSMPEPLRANLASAHDSLLFADLAGQHGHEALAACATSTAGRLPLLMLAPVITAYEQEISADDPVRRCTWRQDRYAPCPRAQAAAYLNFLASLGYELSVIEQAIADDVPYTGETPSSDELTAAAADAADEPGPPGEHAAGGEDIAGAADPAASDSQPEDAGSPAQAAA